MISVSSRTSARARSSAALSPRDGSMRMSSGPSARYEKPRAGSSICGEETPRSRSTPSTCASARPSSTSSSSENHARRNAKRGSSSAAASRAASGSRSSATVDRRGPDARGSRANGRRARTWRRRTRRRRAAQSAATASCSRTGTCSTSVYRATPSSSGGSPSVGKAAACAVCADHCVSSQTSNLWPCPTSTTCLSSAA